MEIRWTKCDKFVLRITKKWLLISEFPQWLWTIIMEFFGLLRFYCRFSIFSAKKKFNDRPSPLTSPPMLSYLDYIISINDIKINRFKLSKIRYKYLIEVELLIWKTESSPSDCWIEIWNALVWKLHNQILNFNESVKFRNRTRISLNSIKTIAAEWMKIFHVQNRPVHDSILDANLYICCRCCCCVHVWIWIFISFPTWWLLFLEWAQQSGAMMVVVVVFFFFHFSFSFLCNRRIEFVKCSTWL